MKWYLSSPSTSRVPVRIPGALSGLGFSPYLRFSAEWLSGVFLPHLNTKKNPSLSRFHSGLLVTKFAFLKVPGFTTRINTMLRTPQIFYIYEEARLTQSFVTRVQRNVLNENISISFVSFKLIAQKNVYIGSVRHIV